jgi:site-specific DNA recombinase
VSSDHQAKNNTIDSQIQALLSRIQQDNLSIEEELQFIDDGYSGSTIIRPALEQLLPSKQKEIQINPPKV